MYDAVHTSFDVMKEFLITGADHALAWYLHMNDIKVVPSVSIADKKSITHTMRKTSRQSRLPLYYSLSFYLWR